MRQKLLIEKKTIFALFPIGDIFLQTYAISKQIKLGMPDMTQMKIFLKGFTGIANCNNNNNNNNNNNISNNNNNNNNISSNNNNNISNNNNNVKVMTTLTVMRATTTMTTAVTTTKV